MKMENQKNGKTKFETLNSTVSMEHSDGRREDISGRVDDINNYMANAMGISKAIINNVIFCHQEDSNWPLDEGKKLKEKFDAIFGTTEYNKAFDKLAKLRKLYLAQLTGINGEIKLNEEINDQVEKKEKDLKDLKIKHEGIQVKYQEFDTELIPLEKNKEKVLEKEANYAKLYNERIKYEST